MRQEDISAAVKQAMREEREAESRPPLRTLDDVRALSEAEVNDRFDEVSAVLEGGGTPPEAE